MSEQRQFEGVWIPKELWEDKELSINEKVIYKEIESLENNGSCYAGNRHFAEFIGVSESRVSQLISSLVKKGRIKSELTYKKGTKQVDKRILSTTDYYRLIGVKYIKGGIEFTKRGIEDIKHPPLENCEGNSTVYNNTKDISTLYDFSSFWSLYPRKSGSKKSTESLFHDIVTNQEIYDAIMSDLDNRKICKNWVDDNGKWIPGAIKYLENEMWNESYEVIKVTEPYENIGVIL